MSAFPTTFTQEELKSLLDNLHTFAPAEQAQLLEIIDELEKRQHAEKCRTDLIEFAKHMMPDYKVGTHHKQLAQYLEDLAYGRKSRVTVSIAPRMGKSQLTSIFFPAWFIGNWPNKQIMIVSHTADLAVDFGRKVRNLINSEEYKVIFQDVALAADSKSAGRWNTNKGGGFFAVGIGGALAGRGADFLCVHEDTPIPTTQGIMPAGQVQEGTKLLGHGGFNEVQRVFTSVKTSYIQVDDAKLSPDHLVWTHTRGWIEARELTTSDVVDAVSSTQWLGVYYGQAKNTWRKLLSRLQHLGDDASKVQQPKRSKLSIVWWARSALLRAMGFVSDLFGRYGLPTRHEAYSGPDRYQWGLYPRELSMGGPRDTSMQPSQRRQNNILWRDTISIAVEPEDRIIQGYSAAQNICDGDDSRRSYDRRKTELGAAPRTTNEFGWVKRTGVRLISTGRKKLQRSQGQLVGCFEAIIASRIFGLLVGVRRVKTLTEVQCGSSTKFVDFQTTGSNTFYVGELMTHNCIDDAHSEQEVLNGNFEIFEKAYEWYAYGARTRLMPNGSVAIIGTRWAEQDLIGQVQKDMIRNPNADQWEVIEFPALLEKKNASPEADDTERYISLWPEQWSLESLLRTKASMPPFQWSAQYMQQPTSRDAAIIKREWWNQWIKDDPPACEYVIMSLDAAAEKTNRSDFTALTTWGVFYKDDEHGQPQANIILLNSIKERLEFPELKRLAYAQYQHWSPDWFIIERKSSGSPLYQEMRRGGIPVQDYTPHRGTGDKVMRLNSVSDIFATGLVWYPAGRRWAEEVVDEVCGFPAMPHDDLVDSTVMALMRFRDGGFIRLPSDIWEDDYDFTPVRANYY